MKESHYLTQPDGMKNDGHDSSDLIIFSEI